MNDRDLERAWHEASNELPPVALDAAIIAAAGSSASARVEEPVGNTGLMQSPSRLAQWQSLAAAAAVAGLAFVLVQTLPRKRDLASPMQRQESVPAAPAAKSPSAVSSARTESAAIMPNTADESSNARDFVAVPSDATAQGRASSQPALPAPSTPASPSATATEESVGEPAQPVGELSTEHRKAVAPPAADRAMSYGVAAAAPSSAQRTESTTAVAPDAPAWAAKIAALHASGNVTAAGQALREFRDAEPRADTYLPESLRDWAATIH
jgi:hypothetical protein